MNLGNQILRKNYQRYKGKKSDNASALKFRNLYHSLGCGNFLTHPFRSKRLPHPAAEEFNAGGSGRTG